MFVGPGRRTASGPELLRSRYAMSYLRGPLTRADLERLTAADGAAAGAGRAPRRRRRGRRRSAPPGRRPGSRSASPACAAPPICRPHLLVKAAVRYRLERGATAATTAEETLLRAFPLAGVRAPPRRSRASRSRSRRRRSATAAAGNGLRRRSPGALLADRKAVEKAVRDRLPDRLATVCWWDPATEPARPPGRAPRRRSATGSRRRPRPARQVKLKEKIERRRLDLAAAERDLASRKREKWAAAGAAVLRTWRARLRPQAQHQRRRHRAHQGPHGGHRRGAPAQAPGELAGLEAELAARARSTPRGVERRLVPSKADVDLLRLELVWIGWAEVSGGLGPGTSARTAREPRVDGASPPSQQRAAQDDARDA